MDKGDIHGSLYQNFLEPCISGERVFARKHRFTLYERKNIIYKFMRHAVTGLIDPLSGNDLLVVCGRRKGNESAFAAIFPIRCFTLESYHFSAFTGQCSFYSGLSGQKCLVNIGLRRNMRAAALKQA